MSPNIITRRSLEVPVGIQLAIEGWYTVELIDSVTKCVKKTWHFKNLITTAGMNGIGNGTSLGSLINYVGVGTGNTAPAFTDTDLVNEIARTDNDGGFGDTNGSGGSFLYWYYKKTRLFLEAEANGNLTEIGFWKTAPHGTGGDILFNRQLFKDAFNNPVTVVKTAAEQLKIIFEWRIYMDQAETNQTVSIGGVSTDLTNRVYDVDNSQSWGAALLTNFGGFASTLAYAFEEDAMPSLTGTQTGSNDQDSSATVQAYVNGNFYRDIQFKWEPGIANYATGIGSIASRAHNAIGTAMNWITTFSPKINKDNTKRVVFQPRYSWARH